MKFKYLIIAFSVIVVIILITMAMLPTLLAVPEAAASMRHIAMPLFVFMAVVLFSLGGFFIFNYRLLSLLEREDWPALAYYLEQKTIVKGRYSVRKVRLLASSYMVMSDYPSVLKLESKAALSKPQVVVKNILIFGAARILSGKYMESASFFKTYLDRGRLKPSDAQWCRWFYGFSFLLAGDFNRVEPEFINLATSSNDVLITGLSAYFLINNLAKRSLNLAACEAAAESGKERVAAAVKNAEGWKKQVANMENDIHIAIIRKYVDEAGNWLFADNNNKAEKTDIPAEQDVSYEIQTEK